MPYASQSNDIPFWRKERAQKRELRKLFRQWHLKLPRLQTIYLVELDQLLLPAWARVKAVKGLTVTASTVWLKRIAATKLAALDREAGGDPKLTETQYRRCTICDRPLLGAEAEARWELDRQSEGHRIPCGPDCVELERVRRARR